MDGTLTEPSLELAADRLLLLQQEDGCWEGEMVWCTMILAQYVIVHHVLGRRWHDTERQAILRNFEIAQTADGAWGLHPESHGYVFNTTLAYIALRVLGVPADAPLASRARLWLHSRPEGVHGIPTWGKFWLALLGLYDYDRVNPTLPELFLLPEWLPIHPSRYYCHTRYIYLAMSFLHGTRFTAKLGSLGDELRNELFAGRTGGAGGIAKSDLYVQPSVLLRAGFALLRLYDRRHSTTLRKRALDYCLQRIVYEQRATRFQGLSPVNGLLNTVALHSCAHPEAPASIAGLEAWRWEDEAEGLRYAGARSQTWDTAFALQALLDGPPHLLASARGALLRGYAYLRNAQIAEELPAYQEERRQAIQGGWCFSDGVHRWPVSDCTAEALCAILKAHRRMEVPPALRIADDCLAQAVRFLLARQNGDGGFGTYERRRGPLWLEALNPSEMYGACMVEGSYIECTGSALAALGHFRDSYPHVLRGEIDRAVRAGERFLRRAQLPDGAWPGAWGVHYTYGIFHAVKGLRAVGVPASDRAMQRAAAWLIGKQRSDGGWGEHFQSCLKSRYVERDSQPVMTSWAVLALKECVTADNDALRRGLAWLIDHQLPDGGWHQNAVNGVFFGTAMLDYRLYKFYFPTWALTCSSRGAC